MIFCAFSSMTSCSVAGSTFFHGRNLLDEMRNCSNRKRGRRKKSIFYEFGLMPFLLMASKRSLPNRQGDGSANASELAEDHNSPEEDSTPPDFALALPASLNWLWSLSTQVDGPSPQVGRRRMGVIFELEGVIVENGDPELEPHAWFILCKEEGRLFPLDTVLRSIEGMKIEEAIAEVLGWSEDPVELQRLATRKEEIYRSLRGCNYRLRPGTQEFLSRLMDYNIPMAVVSARPQKGIEEAIRAVGLEGYFACVMAAEDFSRGKPDPEMFNRAAELLELETERCIVIGNSDSTVVAAATAGMSSVVVASNKPVYDFRVAERVVRSLDELSISYIESRTNPIQQRAREMHMEMEGSSNL
ncbi:hypothetical protein Cni_G08904 [Canna indica]|uniref:Uncharacterized protein n=1 Tax=Canna indica TaxID=4628 RepID=A0AAQ3K720_9LILI|nr:hypothetical protein Cni_G08904 [Canna indica]